MIKHKYQKETISKIQRLCASLLKLKSNDPDMITANQSSNTLALPRHNRTNRYWVNNNPSAPMKEYHKIHQNNIPIRTIISCINSLNYKASKLIKKY